MSDHDELKPTSEMSPEEYEEWLHEGCIHPYCLLFPEDWAHLDSLRREESELEIQLEESDQDPTPVADERGWCCGQPSMCDYGGCW
jgi:hypothetical protein